MSNEQARNAAVVIAHDIFVGMLYGELPSTRALEYERKATGHVECVIREAFDPIIDRLQAENKKLRDACQDGFNNALLFEAAIALRGYAQYIERLCELEIDDRKLDGNNIVGVARLRNCADRLEAKQALQAATLASTPDADKETQADTCSKCGKPWFYEDMVWNNTTRRWCWDCRCIQVAEIPRGHPFSAHGAWVDIIPSPTPDAKQGGEA